MSTFPAVATVMGLSKEVAESGPLLATLAVDPSVIATTPPPSSVEQLEIQAGDPVTQAVVDNIIGKHPTKKESVKFKCETCNIMVSSIEILNIHYSGAKHAKKVKGQELFKKISNSLDSTFVVCGPLNGINNNTKEFTCQICNVSVNSYQQLQQHMFGSKHKTKAESTKSNITKLSVPSSYDGQKGEVTVDIGPNRLYCAACNVHVNSDLQLHQHITSSKHANKVNGRTQKNSRQTPYSRPKAISSILDNSHNGYTAQQESEWQNWQQDTKTYVKTFVSGGVLYNK